MPGYGINHPSARRAFSMELQRVVPMHSFFYENGLIAPSGSNDGIIIEMDELATSRGNGRASGYEVTYDLDGHFQGYTTPGDKPIKGDEKQLSMFQDKIQINQERFSASDEGNFSNQLIPYDSRKRILDAKADYWSEFFDERVIAKLSGALGDGTYLTIDTSKPVASARDVKGSVASDGNDLRAPSATRIVYGPGVANWAAITNQHKMSLDIIDRAILQAVRPDKNTGTKRLVQPLKQGGRRVMVMLMDYVQAMDLGSIQSSRYFTIQQAMAQGGMKDSALLRGGLAVYRSPVGVDVILMSHPKMVKFNTTTTGGQPVIRALLLGKGAGRIAYGRDSKKLPKYSSHEELDDRGNQLVITSGVTVGVQKSAYGVDELATTREDWGVVAVDTYGDWLS